MFFKTPMSTIEVKVPDIGDFKDIPVIEVFVKPGDVVKAEDSLVTLESDKATMDVPSPAAGTVKEVKVKLGDKVSEGSLIIVLEPAAAGAAGAAKVDLEALRGWKNKVVGKLTGGLTGMAKARKVEVVRGVGRFLDPHHVEVELTEGQAQAKTGKKTVVRFEQAIIAAGSQSVR